MENGNYVGVEGISGMHSSHGHEAPIKCENILVKIT